MANLPTGGKKLETLSNLIEGLRFQSPEHKNRVCFEIGAVLTCLSNLPTIGKANATKSELGRLGDIITTLTGQDAAPILTATKDLAADMESRAASRA